MGEVKQFPKVKLVTGILISQLSFRKPLLHSLEEHFGPSDFVSEYIPFTFSSYYNQEMGIPINRFFISFKNLISPETLASIKNTTNQIEQSFLDQGHRKVNIDPGILLLSRFILASTKDGIQRVPINNGIYGEITLIYEKKTYRPVEWTYPDFRSEKYLKLLNTIRDIYKEQLDSAF